MRKWVIFAIEMIVLIGLFCLLGFLTKPAFDEWVTEGRTALVDGLSLVIIFAFLGGWGYLTWFNFRRK